MTDAMTLDSGPTSPVPMGAVGTPPPPRGEILRIDQLRTDGGTRPRAVTDFDAVVEYAGAMGRDEHFPPVTVFHDGENYWLAHGFHRREAALEAGFDEIECEVHHGTLLEAQWYSYATNRTNGVRRSNDDKARAVKAALVHPKAAGLSNYQIAKHCGVAESTVRNWREQLPSTQNAQMKTVTRNGTTYLQDTTNIGKCKEGRTDEDAVPELLPQTPVSVFGDLWNLGSHKLLVGDSTDRSQVARLMAGESADLLFIDSPYNVAYEGHTEEHLTIKNDRMSDADFTKFLEAAFRSCRAAAKPSASLYVCHPSSRQREFQNALEVAGFEVRCQIIWAKNTFAWGHGRYKFQHEPIFYAHVAGQSDAWYGDKSQSTLWEEKKPAANRLHPTMKPVELIKRALVNSSKVGDLVADLFGGSGSTLIACEDLGRAARLMEIDPRYADVICRRYQEHTGKQAVLDGDGRSFDEIARQPRKEAA